MTTLAVSLDGGAPSFSELLGITLGNSGSLYVSDLEEKIRKVAASGNVTTFAGANYFSGQDPDRDGTGGPDGTATFNGAERLVFDAEGNLYVAEWDGHRIRRIDPKGNVTTIAGNNIAGDADGTGDPNGTAELSAPVGVAIDSDGNVIVADRGSFRIRKIDPNANVTTLAGNGTVGDADGTGGRNGTAEFVGPYDVAADGSGNAYVTDGYRVRKIDSAGNVTTFAGNGNQGFADGTGGRDGTAEFGILGAIALGATGDLYIADWGNARIRKIDAEGNVTTLAGNGTKGYADGAALSAEFGDMRALTIDDSGTVFVADDSHIRVIHQ